MLEFYNSDSESHKLFGGRYGVKMFDLLSTAKLVSEMKIINLQGE